MALPQGAQSSPKESPPPVRGSKGDGVAARSALNAMAARSGRSPWPDGGPPGALPILATGTAAKGLAAVLGGQPFQFGHQLVGGGEREDLVAEACGTGTERRVLQHPDDALADLLPV